ncbi:MAG: hypothetical protein IKT14_07285, partial [Clostridiales bacterium]|nr:hypothetical protein [Clostridiales bacterium]
DTNVEEHIEKVKKELEALGYEVHSTYDGESSQSQNSGGKNYTSMEEYIEETNKQWEAVGYTNDNGGGTQKSATGSAATSQKCDHSYSPDVTKEATCVAEGETKYTCSKCGATYTEAIPATGEHDYVAEVTKEATCTEKGETTYTCSVCGDSYTEEIAAAGHKYDRCVAEDATCTMDGTFVYICEVCDDSYTEIIPASGHKESELTVVKQPGLFTKGEQQIVCDNCGEVLSSEVIPSKLPVTALLAPFFLLMIGGVVIVSKRKKKEDPFSGTNELKKDA